MIIYTYDDMSSAYSVNATTLGKRSYRRIARICDGNGAEHEEPKTGTGAGEKQESSSSSLKVKKPRWLRKKKEKCRHRRRTSIISGGI